MPQLVTRRVDDIPFRFEVEKDISEEPKVEGTLTTFSWSNNRLLDKVIGLCLEQGKGFYSVYILALPDKGDTLEGLALSMMDQLSKELDSRGVQYRQMLRNMNIEGISDAVDAVLFRIYLPK